MATNMRLEKGVLVALNARAIGQNLCGMRFSTLLSDLDLLGVPCDEMEVRQVVGKLLNLGQITVKEISPGSQYYFIAPNGIERMKLEGWQ